MATTEAFPLGERAILEWTQGWPRSLVVGLGLLATAAVGLADYGVARVFGYDFVATGFYLVPIGFVAFVAGTRCGLLVAVAAALAQGAIRRFVFRERRLSRHDSVTGVGNALGFREAAGWEIARGRRWPGVVARVHLNVTRDLAEAGFPVTASVGATTFPTAPETVDEMIGAADGAMYAVKHGSKNGVHHFMASGQLPPVRDVTRRVAAGVDSPLPS